MRGQAFADVVNEKIAADRCVRAARRFIHERGAVRKDAGQRQPH